MARRPRHITYDANKGTNRFGGRQIKCQNDFEAKLMRQLDESPHVLHWQYEPVDVSHPDLDRPHRPDFIIALRDGTKRVVEGKSDYSLQRWPEREAAKEEAARRWAGDNGHEYVTVFYRKAGDWDRSFCFMMGTPEYDWEMLRRRKNELEDADIEWWDITELQPLLREGHAAPEHDDPFDYSEYTGQSSEEFMYAFDSGD